MSKHSLKLTLNDSQGEPRVRSRLYFPSFTRTHNPRNSLLPVMISRLMLSLKKASRDRESGWTSNAFSRTHPKIITPIAFRGRRNRPEDGGSITFDEMELSDLDGEQVSGQSGGVRAV